MRGRTSFLVVAMAVTLAAPSLAASQAWQVRHQSGAYGEEIDMSAFADADSGPDRINIYCDSRDGFRLMISPHRLAMTAGTGHVILTIDGGQPVTLAANAFGDDAMDTDIVTVYNTDKIEEALSGASHVTVKFVGYDNSASQAAFTFQGMAAEKAAVLKTCPLTTR
jgi:hypothetical protein